MKFYQINYENSSSLGSKIYKNNSNIQRQNFETYSLKSYGQLKRNTATTKSEP